MRKKVIDTTNLSPRKLREEIMQAFSTGSEGIFTIQVMSFGFKYGLPIDADVVMDVRFLPNPHYIAELRPLTGLDEPVYDYVMSQPEAKTFYHKLMDLLDFSIPGYKKRRKIERDDCHRMYWWATPFCSFLRNVSDANYYQTLIT